MNFSYNVIFFQWLSKTVITSSTLAQLEKFQTVQDVPIATAISADFFSSALFLPRKCSRIFSYWLY
jgi:hypothetical protein